MWSERCCGLTAGEQGTTGASACVLIAADAPLAAQFDKELREVARLKGIKPDKLANPVATS